MSEAPPLPTPRATFRLVGHAAAERTVLAAVASGRMPNAWLISGPRGVGKATLAFRIARFLLAHGDSAPTGDIPATKTLAVDPQTPAVRLVTASSHPDLLVIERPFLNDRNTETVDLNITQARRIAPFLRMRPAEGAWRVVIVDNADALNANSANAILKIVEEPPDRSVVLLLAEKPGALLPTIRSRCRRLDLMAMDEVELAQLLVADEPGLTGQEAAALARLSGGCLGQALVLQQIGGPALDATVARLLDDLPDLDLVAVHDLAGAIAAKGADDRFDLLAAILDARLADRAREAALAGRRDGLERWITLWEKTRSLFAQAVAANLDRRQVILQVFGEIRAASRP
ncbi:MAG: DNA polymerase III subunit delta' [Rhodospirillaceae bacterium]|nr:DNA polymerase III subunit delta' [Rhodospirillaceae bacterium]